MIPIAVKTQNPRRKIQDLHCYKITADINISCLSEIISRQPQPAILGGNSSVNGFSYWMARSVEIFEFRMGQSRPFEKLEKALGRYKLNSSPLPQGMFTGGWVGFFSYDLGRFIEPVPQQVDNLRLPLIRLCFYDRLIAYDHREKEFWLIALELEDDIETTQEKLSYLAGLIDKAKTIESPAFLPADIEKIDFAKIQANMTKDYYLRAFEKIKRHIYDGDVYQINFSRRFDCKYNARPIDLFNWQNRFNPSPYSAYIDADNFQIVSASPEMFITIRDGVISTKPIKGTRKRIEETNPETKQTNAENFQQLLNSEKEKAELNMIIDLERNDVARICRPGTRMVSQPRTIEAHPTVFHAVATVSGRLRDDVNFSDVLKAMFPGGSITGAPKIRAMQIINEIEPTARGIYTGSIGYIGLNGSVCSTCHGLPAREDTAKMAVPPSSSVCLNIAIRTIIIKNNTAYVQTGGGIVADSNSQAEYEETIIKAQVLLAGIAAVNR